MQCTYSLDIHLRSLPTKPVGIRLIDARTGETSDNQEDLTIVLRACQMPYNMGHTHTHFARTVQHAHCCIKLPYPAD